MENQYQKNKKEKWVRISSKRSAEKQSQSRLLDAQMEDTWSYWKRKQNRRPKRGAQIREK